jgi:hypothetical protein
MTISRSCSATLGDQGSDSSTADRDTRLRRVDVCRQHGKQEQDERDSREAIDQVSHVMGARGSGV